GVARPGLDDNFFALGGHSLLIARVLTAVRERLFVSPTLRSFFERPTVRGMAEAVLEAQTLQAEPDLVRELLDQVQGVSSTAPPSVEPDRRSAQDRADGARLVMSGPRGTAEDIRAFAAAADDVRGVALRTLAVPTCDRVTGLRRALLSYGANAHRHGHEVEFVVMDNSSSAATRDAYRTMLQDLARSEKAEIHYGGAEEKVAWLDLCHREAGLPREVLAFALFGHREGPYNAANNANANLLHTVGRPVLCADDDTLGETYVSPGLTDGMALSSGSPEINWAFADRGELEATMVRSDRDIFGEHGRLLGRTPASFAAELLAHGLPLDEFGLPAAALRDPSTAAGRAALSVPSLVGDCGWASPSTYLNFDGESLSRLIRSEEDYRAGRVSRLNARFVDRPTFTRDMTSFMCTFYGADNRRLLLPYLPCTKGNDTLYALLHSICFPDDYFVYSPVAFSHQPVETRRFWDHEILRGASGIDFSYLVAALLEPLRVSGLSAVDGAGRMRELGSCIRELGLLPAEEFDERSRRQVRALAERDLAEQRQRLAAHSGPPSWRRDLKEYIALRARSMDESGFAVPLDLAVDKGADRARELSRLFLRDFGELLMAWPDIVTAAGELAERGHRLGRRIGGVS
ncbi:phosphopantetheine-binding protein, partial [Streptomyces alanosinicus]|uniref:phosphopantetheine-binding protein n=1 Tax=Streptomyces alanosinicus TaxID=68171 RepID=UPI0016790379